MKSGDRIASEFGKRVLISGKKLSRQPSELGVSNSTRVELMEEYGWTARVPCSTRIRAWIE